MVFQPKQGDAVRLGLAVMAAFACVALAPVAARAQSAVQVVNQVILTITQQTSGLLIAGPPDVALQMAIVDNAMYDAVNAATGAQYKPIAFTGGAVSGVSADAAAYSAAATALTTLFGQSAWTPTTGPGAYTAAIQTAVNIQIGLLQNAATNTGDSAAITLGQNAANAVTTAAGSTLSSANTAMIAGLSRPVVPGAGTPGVTPDNGTPGIYVQPVSRPEMYPTWGGVAPIGVTGAQLSAAEQIATLVGVGGATTTDPTTGAALVQTSIASAAYAQDILITECQGSGVASQAITNACAAASAIASAAAHTTITISPQTVAQARSALFWNDPGTTIQPPGHWLQIVNTAAAAANLSTLQAARLSAAVSTAQYDAGVAAWGDKYIYNLWRPITAIADCNSATGAYSWNTTLNSYAGSSSTSTCSQSWTSLIATPPHPDFVAGHPAFSGAAASVLDGFFGTSDVQTALGIAAITSVSNSYCNGGAAIYGTGDGVTITGCRMTAAQLAGSAYATQGGNGSFDSGTNSYTFTACNAIAADSNMADQGTAALTIGNNSPFICSISINFATFDAASSGTYGSEFSRVAGGIHTTTAVEQALLIGNSLGATVFAQNFYQVPEPSSLMLLSVAGVGLIGAARRRRS
jgi:hypothetical protein